MKIRIAPSVKNQGSTLITTLGTCSIIGVTLASYLLLVQSQSVSVARSQNWNDTMVVTEAGIEDGLQLINKYAGTPILSNWTNGYAADNWDQVSSAVYHVRRYINGDANVYYDVYITNLVSGPQLTAIGHAPAPQLFSLAAPPSYFAAAGVTVSSSSTLVRSVNVQTRKDPMFNFALAAQTTINMNGNNVATDSFDSSNTNYSNADGSYNSSKDKDGGDVLSNGTITNTINIGNANIMGHAKTGPNGTVKVGPNGSVGSKSFVQNPSNGGSIQSGWSGSDMNVAFPDVPTPDTIYGSGLFWTIAPSGQTVVVNGSSVSFNMSMNTPGNAYYKLASLSGKVYIGTNVHAVIWVTGNASFAGQDQITIAQGGSLTIYMGGTFSTSGNATVNNLGKNSADFYLMGLPTCTSVSIKGNAAITGIIYAPEAALTLGGGGNNSYDFVGSAMANSVTMGGHMNFHYDEALKNKAFARGYIPSNWVEVY